MKHVTGDHFYDGQPVEFGVHPERLFHPFVTKRPEPVCTLSPLRRRISRILFWLTPLVLGGLVYLALRSVHG